MIVHKAESNEFLQIIVQEVQCFETADDAVVVPNVNDNNEKYIRVTVGEQQFSLIFPEKSGVLAEKLPVYAGQEVWMSASSCRKYAVYGVCSKQK